MHEPRPFDHATTWPNDHLRRQAMRHPDTCSVYKDYSRPALRRRPPYFATAIMLLVVAGLALYVAVM